VKQQQLKADADFKAKTMAVKIIEASEKAIQQKL